MHDTDIPAFQSALLKWFRAHAREMPWRANKDPYRIWVSEIMLQQTQVNTVRPYFERFIRSFPTVTALAEAPLDTVLKHWEGLGYYSRARNLHKGAQQVVSQFGGQMPRTPDEIRRISGIGPYSAGAILSIAFDVPEPAVDGNVIRVFTRLDAQGDDVSKTPVVKALTTRVRSTIPAAAGDFNQALMELGALVCRPDNPLCGACPVQAFCSAYAQGKPEQYPVKGKRTPVNELPLWVALVQNAEGQWLVHRQDQGGIFKGLWCFPLMSPQADQTPQIGLQTYLQTHLGVAVQVHGHLTEVTHTLTHRHMRMQVYACTLASVPAHNEGLAWVSPGHHPDHAMPIAHQKIARFVQAHPLLWLLT
jgi:A/G-specific adenine glycosylase